MREPVSESDILALVEGTVPAARVEEIRAALRADPVLRARIEKMAADRDRLARLSDRVPAPADTVALAMDRAALEVAGVGSSAPGARGRRIAMVAAAGLLVAVLAGVVGLVVRATHPELRAARVADAPEGSAPVMEMVGVEAPVVAPEMVGPIEESEVAATGEGAVTTTAEDIARRFAELGEADGPDPVLEEFLRKIDERSGAIAVDEAGLTDAALARLARAGRVEIVVVTDGPVGVGVGGGGGDGRGPVVIPGAIGVDIPVDGGDAGVRDALDRAVAGLRADAGVRVEFRELVGAGVGGSGGGRWSVDPRAVVWWSQGSGEWRTVRRHVIPVRRVSSGG